MQWKKEGRFVSCGSHAQVWHYKRLSGGAHTALAVFPPGAAAFKQQHCGPCGGQVVHDCILCAYSLCAVGNVHQLPACKGGSSIMIGCFVPHDAGQ
jgi:hypothetical protein